MSSLAFESVTLTNFKAFLGEHTFVLAREPGLYYVAGVNKVDPELGANGVGKSTIWDAVSWCLWARTIRDVRPADAVAPWGKKLSTVVALRFTRRGKRQTLVRQRRPNSLTLLTSTKSVEVAQEQVAELLWTCARRRSPRCSRTHSSSTCGSALPRSRIGDAASTKATRPSSARP
jgi:DNA repair exonuclease SbcCD ATPase subunit